MMPLVKLDSRILHGGHAIFRFDDHCHPPAQLRYYFVYQWIPSLSGLRIFHRSQRTAVEHIACQPHHDRHDAQTDE